MKKEIVKRIFIAGAGAALSYKEKHPRATDSETMSHVTKEMHKLISDIEMDK